MSEIRPRIIGTEMEWGVVARLVGEGEHFNRELENPGDATGKYLHPKIKTSGQKMLSNGGRFYQDVGFHLEYASAEDTTFESAVIGEFAGEQIVIDALHRLVRASEKYDAIKLRKRVIDSNGTTWGYHLNFLSDRTAIPNPSQNLGLMGLHYATSLPIFGGGAIVRNKISGEYHYSFGQKVNELFHDIDGGTTSTQKPVINLRDQPLANKDLYRRIHHTSTDPHILPWATRITLGSYSLVLRAIEQGHANDLRLTPDKYSVTPILDLARQNSVDLSMRSVKHEINNKTMRQIDVQHEIINAVSKTNHTDEEEKVLEEWRQAVEALETNPKQLVFRSDAITRLQLIQEKVEKSGGDPNDMSLDLAQNVDAVYDTLAVVHHNDSNAIDCYNDSLPSKLRARPRGDHLDASLIMHRMFNPPQTTRAKLRAEGIAAGAENADWNYYVPNGDKKSVTLNDPYMTEYPARTD